MGMTNARLAMRPQAHTAQYLSLAFLRFLSIIATWGNVVARARIAVVLLGKNAETTPAHERGGSHAIHLASRQYDNIIAQHNLVWRNDFA